MTGYMEKKNSANKKPPSAGEAINTFPQENTRVVGEKKNWLQKGGNLEKQDSVILPRRFLLPPALPLQGRDKDFMKQKVGPESRDECTPPSSYKHTKRAGSISGSTLLRNQWHKVNLFSMC